MSQRLPALMLFGLLAVYLAVDLFPFESIVIEPQPDGKNLGTIQADIVRHLALGLVSIPLTAAAFIAIASKNFRLHRFWGYGALICVAASWLYEIILRKPLAR